MKVAIAIANQNHYSGGCYYTYQVAYALQALGHHVLIYSNKRPVFLDDFKWYGRLPHVLVSDIEKPDAIDFADADVYIGAPIFGTWIASRMGEIKNRPAISFVFDTLPQLRKAISAKEYKNEEAYFGRIEGDLAKEHLHVVTCSEFTAEGVHEWVGKDKSLIHSLHPCVNTEAIKHKVVNDDDEGVLFVSRLVKRKRYEDLVKIADKIDRPLNIVSSIFEADAKAKLQHKNIRLHENISDARKFGLLSKCDAVVSTSQFEGFGIYAIEGYALGKPLIAKSLPTFAEMEGKTKHIVAETTEDMIEAINGVPKMKVRNAYYDFDKFVKRVDKVLCECLQKSK